MAEDHWFRPKNYGFGAQPSSWQGWAATIAFVMSCVVWANVIQLSGSSSARDWLVFALGLVALIAGFMLFARKKTDGAWRWRWGKKGRE